MPISLFIRGSHCFSLFERSLRYFPLSGVHLPSHCCIIAITVFLSSIQSSCSTSVLSYVDIIEWSLHTYIYFVLFSCRKNSLCFPWGHSSKICEDIWQSCTFSTSICYEWWILQSPQPTNGILLEWSKCRQNKQAKRWNESGKFWNVSLNYQLKTFLAF